MDCQKWRDPLDVALACFGVGLGFAAVCVGVIVAVAVAHVVIERWKDGDTQANPDT